MDASGMISDITGEWWMHISCIIQVSMAVASVMPADTYDGCMQQLSMMDASGMHAAAINGGCILNACSHQ